MHFFFFSDLQSPISLAERFQSPSPAAMSSARRRLFATTTSSSTTGQITLTIPQQTVNHLSTNETTVINTTPVMSPARNVTIILQRTYYIVKTYYIAFMTK